MHTISRRFGDPSARPLRFGSTIDRALVHRSAIAEVFLTDVIERESGVFDCGVQWPRRHMLYRSEDGGIDGSLVAETVRQLTIAVAHLGYGVTDDEHFLMTGMRYGIDAARLPERSGPPELVARVEVDGVRATRDGRTRALRASVTLSIDGATIATGRGDAAIVADAAYRRLRGSVGDGPLADSVQSPGTRAAPADVGVSSEKDVLLAEGKRTPGWSILVDPTHPIYFDHPLDHVPGMLLIDAMRQAARLHLRRPDLDLGAFEAHFSRVVELSPPATVTVSDDRSALSFEVRQSGEVAAVASGRMRTTPARSSG